MPEPLFYPDPDPLATLLEVGGWKSEVGSRRSEVGRQKSEVGAGKSADAQLYRSPNPSRCKDAGALAPMDVNARAKAFVRPECIPWFSVHFQAFEMTQEPDPKVRRISFRLTNLPSLPEVVTKVLSLSEKTASTKEFADLIATDQGLAAKVLRLINSAFYSLRSPVSSLRHASALLGVRTLKSMALSVSAIHLFRRPMPPYDPTLFWRHCLAVALAGPKIARKFG